MVRHYMLELPKVSLKVVCIVLISFIHQRFDILADHLRCRV